MPEAERNGVGRRGRDQACLDHEQKINEIKADMDVINQNVAKNSGRFAAMLWFMGIIGAAMTIGITITITMLSGIQASLSANNVTMAEDRRDIKTIREIEIPQIKKDITDINDRHKWLDQNGVTKKVR
jgi:hypothetical protein